MRPTILVGTLLLILAIGGCGGGSGESASSAATAVKGTAGATNGASMGNAEAICSEMVAKSRQMGAEFKNSRSDLTSDPLVMTTQSLIKPAIPIVEGGARQLRALKPAANSVRFDAYVNLFDPILALLRERLAAGEAGDPNRAHELELQLIELSALQGTLARNAGLKRCDVDFVETFSSSGGTR